jgi:hypothetical protein
MGRTKVSDGHTAKMEMTRDFRRKSLNTDGEIFNNGVDRAANARGEWVWIFVAKCDECVLALIVILFAHPRRTSFD